MLKVPAQRQVRIIRPQPEDAVPHYIINEERAENSNELFKFVKKTLGGGGIGMIIGLGLYLALQFCGVRFGELETIVILGIPCFAGIVTSYVIF
jgi:hypothetical protein